MSYCGLNPNDIALLEVRYDSVRIPLITGGVGVNLKRWNPVVTPYKGGGTFYSPTFQDGQQLMHRVFDSPNETMALSIQGSTQDNAILYLRQLIAAAEKAANYWTTRGENSPVYLVAQSKYESNPRYATIVSWQFGDTSDPYQMPFGDNGNNNSVIDFDVSFIRGHWMDVAPGGTVALPLAGYATFNSVTLGNVDTTETVTPTSDTPAVYLVNSNRVSNLTHAYLYDASLTLFTDIFNVAPVNLLPGVTENNDVLYLGTQTSLTDSGPFCNVIFDIGVAGSGYTLTWQYWNGAWSALATNDDTGQLKTAGIGAVAFTPPTDWQTRAVNSVTGYWIRGLVSGVSSPTNPEQYNRPVYATGWGWTEINSDDLPGDIPARIQMRVKGNNLGVPSDPSKMWIGLRTVSRGADFTAYINASQEQNSSGVVVSTTGSYAWRNDTQAPTGDHARSTNGAATFGTDTVRFTFTTTVSQQFLGRFRIFVRGETSDSANASLRVRMLTVNNTVWTSETFTWAADDTVEIFELGVFDLPGNLIAPSEGAEFYIIVDTAMADSTGTIDIWDIFLLPVDEWAVELEAPSGTVTNPTVITEYDSLRYPKFGARAVTFLSALVSVTPTDIEDFLIVSSSGLGVLQPNTTQRIWMLNDYPGSWYLCKIWINKGSVYLTHRGAT